MIGSSRASPAGSAAWRLEVAERQPTPGSTAGRIVSWSELECAVGQRRARRARRPTRWQSRRPGSTSREARPGWSSLQLTHGAEEAITGDPRTRAPTARSCRAASPPRPVRSASRDASSASPRMSVASSTRPTTHVASPAASSHADTVGARVATGGRRRGIPRRRRRSRRAGARSPRPRPERVAATSSGPVAAAARCQAHGSSSPASSWAAASAECAARSCDTRCRGQCARSQQRVGERPVDRRRAPRSRRPRRARSRRRRGRALVNAREQAPAPTTRCRRRARPARRRVAGGSASTRDRKAAAIESATGSGSGSGWVPRRWCSSIPRTQHVERERVAAGRVPATREHRVVDAQRCEQLGGRGLAHSVDRQPLDVVELVRLAAAGGDQQPDPVEDQALERGDDHLRRRAVEPLAVVDDEDDRLFLGGRGEEGDEPATQRQRVGRRGPVVEHLLQRVDGAGLEVPHLRPQRAEHRAESGEGERRRGRDRRHGDGASADPRDPGTCSPQQ